MELGRIIEALSKPEAYPHEVDAVQVRQTHISVVFLAGAFAYKVKKPVDLGFLDFSTLEKRRHFCEEEVRLNRRLAPAVYLGVVPVTRDATGVRVEGDGEVVEWAVKMARLPDEATLLRVACGAARWMRGSVEMPWRERVAGFHAAGRVAARGSRRSGASRSWPATPGRTSSSPRPWSATPSAASRLQPAQRR